MYLMGGESPVPVPALPLGRPQQNSVFAVRGSVFPSAVLWGWSLMCWGMDLFENLAFREVKGHRGSELDPEAGP